MENTPTRYLEHQIAADLSEKMVFLAGPRQVGKTTLSKQILPKNALYLNYDITSDRSRILKQEFDDSALWIFDEIHKYKKWKNYLKGVFDAHRGKRKILVTGSARLDLFRKAGDSLQGRYHLLRMHPLSAQELKCKTQTQLLELFTLGGFPEPFFSGKKTAADRWSREYHSRVIEDEITKLERVDDLGALELLALRLPDCVGSPLSINSLREDLGYNFATVKRWIGLLERFYAIFRVPPFGSPLIKAVKKEQKHYHFDWNCIENDGARFECMIGAHLLKHCNYLEDTEGRRMGLRFFRDIEAREVDFVIAEKERPLMAVECKLGDEEPSKALIYFKRKFPHAECYQIHMRGKKDFVSKDGIRVAPAIELLKTLT